MLKIYSHYAISRPCTVNTEKEMAEDNKEKLKA